MAVSLALYRDRTTIALDNLDFLIATYPGHAERRIAINESRLNARLSKRYAVPFGDPAPEIYIGWVVALTDLDLKLKLGFDPSAQQDALTADAAKAALEDVKEAADSNEGLFDLPLRQDAQGASGITRGGPRAYSDVSPYAWMDRARTRRGGW